MTAPSTPQERMAFGTEIRIVKISYAEFAAYGSEPLLNIDSATGLPNTTTYPSMVEVAKLLTENYESEFGAPTKTVLTHSRGPLKFAQKEFGKMTLRFLDVLDPEILSYFPGLSVAEDADGISIRPARVEADTSNIIAALWPQGFGRLYEILYKPSGEGTWKTSAAADGSSLLQLELVLEGQHIVERDLGDRVGFIYRNWPA